MCVLYIIINTPFQEDLQFYMFCVLCINLMCKVFLKDRKIALECINVI